MMEIVAGVLAFVYRRDIETFMYTELVNGIRYHYPHESQPDTDGLRSTWRFLQTEVSITSGRGDLAQLVATLVKSTNLLYSGPG